MVVSHAGERGRDYLTLVGGEQLEEMPVDPGAVVGAGSTKLGTSLGDVADLLGGLGIDADDTAAIGVVDVDGCGSPPLPAAPSAPLTTRGGV